MSKSSLLDNVFQDLKAKVSDNGNLCFLSQPQATGDTDRALFLELLTKLKEEKLVFPLGVNKERGLKKLHFKIPT